jgi:hypothetical protein
LPTQTHGIHHKAADGAAADPWLTRHKHRPVGDASDLQYGLGVNKRPVVGIREEAERQRNRLLRQVGDFVEHVLPAASNQPSDLQTIAERRQVCFSNLEPASIGVAGPGYQRQLSNVRQERERDFNRPAIVQDAGNHGIAALPHGLELCPINSGVNEPGVRPDCRAKAGHEIDRRDSDGHDNRDLPVTIALLKPLRERALVGFRRESRDIQILRLEP